MKGLGRVYRPTRRCERCRGAGCGRCKDGRRQVATWTIQYSHRNKQYRESTGSTKRSDAVRLLRKRIKEMSPARDFTGPKVEKTTFDDLTRLLITDYENNRRKSTRRARIAVKRLGEYFEGYLAIDITPDRISQYINQRYAENVAPATVRNELNALRRAFRLAHEAGRVAHVPHFPKIDIQNVRTGFFEHEEFELVLKHLPAGLRPVAEFGYLTGWRISEVLGLRWSQVDFKSGIIRLDVGTTKNNDGRVLPFHVLPALSDLLRRQRERTDRKERMHDRVVPWVFHRRGKQILRMDTAWKNACAAAGCPGRLFHDLRRTAVRNLERAGVPRSIAMKITGHKTEAVYRRYAIVNERDVAEGLERLAVWFRDGGRGVARAGTRG